jgi:hypothetical protein
MVLDLAPPVLPILLADNVNLGAIGKKLSSRNIYNVSPNFNPTMLPPVPPTFPKITMNNVAFDPLLLESFG